MSKFKNFIKSPIFIVPVVSLLVAGAAISSFVIPNHNHDDQFVQEVTKESSSKPNLSKEFTSYKQNVQSALTNDDYKKIDGYTDKVSKDLKQDTDFKMFVEDLNVLKETKKGIDDKSITDYDDTLAKLEMYSNTDAILKRKAEDYARTVKELKEEATKESTSSTEHSQEVTQSEPATEADTSQTEATTTQNAEDPYNLVGTYVHGTNGDYRVVEYIKGYYVVATSIPTNYGSKSMYAIYDPEHQILEERDLTDNLTQVENYLGKW